jgi:hypothetical protein
VRPGASIATLREKGWKRNCQWGTETEGQGTTRERSVQLLSGFPNSLGLSAVRADCGEMLVGSLLHGLDPHLFQQHLHDVGPVLHLAAEALLQVAVEHLHTVVGDRLAPRHFSVREVSPVPFFKPPSQEIDLASFSQLVFE